MRDQRPFTYDVFISYSTQDRPWVRQELLPRLEAQGLRACIDYRDFAVGAPIITEIERALLNSRKTLLVLSPAYMQSTWAEFENLVLQTLDPSNQSQRLIPLRKEVCEIPLRIRYLVYVDFAAPDDLDFEWERLLNALGATEAGSGVVTDPPRMDLTDQSQQSSDSQTDLNDLRKKLLDRCSVSDLRDLCFVLNIDDDNYPGAKDEFVRGLLKDLQRQGRLEEFMTIVRQEKPWVLR
jgi:hypothetical protein